MLVSKFGDCPDRSYDAKRGYIGTVLDQSLKNLERNFEKVLENVERLSTCLQNHDGWLQDEVGRVLLKDFEEDAINELCEELQYLLNVPLPSQQIAQVTSLRGLVAEIRKILKSQRTRLLSESEASSESE